MLSTSIFGCATGSIPASNTAASYASGKTAFNASSYNASSPYIRLKTVRDTFPLRKPGTFKFFFTLLNACVNPFSITACSIEKVNTPSLVPFFSHFADICFPPNNI